MELLTFLSGFTPLDAAALATLGVAWVGIGLAIERTWPGRPSVSVLMARYRHAWMRELVRREQRIFDAAILQNLRDGTAFFASTSLLAVGGVLALAGNPAPLEQIAAQLPHGNGTLPAALVWQSKLLLVALLLTSAFLRFVWSNRLFGYFSVLIGSVPNAPGAPLAAHRATQAAELNIRAAANFNRGLRAVYFALAALAWLLGPIPLIVAVLATTWMLGQREFLSRSREVLAEHPPGDDGSDPPLPGP